MKRALIIDDSPTMRAMIRDHLAPLGLEVEEAADGALGLKAARGTAPNVVVVDLMMPVMDGVEFLFELRRDAALRQLPVVVLSANEDQTARLSQSPSARTFIANKPIDPDQLRALVSRALAV